MKSEIDNFIDSIMEKEFKKSFRGYKVKEIEIYLDTIVEFLENLEKVKKENETYISEIEDQNNKLRLLALKINQKYEALKKTHLNNQVENKPVTNVVAEEKVAVINPEIVKPVEVKNEEVVETVKPDVDENDKKINDLIEELNSKSEEKEFSSLINID